MHRISRRSARSQCESYGCQRFANFYPKTILFFFNFSAAVEYSLASINYRLKGQSSCAYLNLGKITDGFFIHHHEKEKEPNLLRVSFTTFPGEGAWEATLIKNGRHWKLTDKVIRTNEYGDQSRCVVQEYKDICYCTDNE